MLTYLIKVTSDLLAAALIFGVCYAFIDCFCKEKIRLIVRFGTAVGVFAAAIRAYITNTRRLSGGWKVGTWGYGIALALFCLTIILLAAFSNGLFGKSKNERFCMASQIVVSSSLALLLASYLYCTLTNPLVYPFQFDTGGNGVLSTEYLFRLGGYLLGLIICGISALSAYHICGVAVKKSYPQPVIAAFVVMNAVYAVFNFAKLMSVLTVRKIVDSKLLFSFSAASNNRSHWYTYGLFCVILAMAAFLWIRSITAKEPYSTKAERRKQRAVWRTGRRFTVVTVLCCVMGVLCSTLFVKLNTVVIREAPVEEPVIIKGVDGSDELLEVPLEMVEDGHLHRFGYETEEGNLVRFIIVQKQEKTNNYGIGLDACEICGEAGYYENKDNQIVCKKCNVVMNKTTIGMKGGCNPIIIDYDMDESKITVPVSEMVNNQARFKD